MKVEFHAAIVVCGRLFVIAIFLGNFLTPKVYLAMLVGAIKLYVAIGHLYAFKQPTWNARESVPSNLLPTTFKGGLGWIGR